MFEHDAGTEVWLRNGTLYLPEGIVINVVEFSIQNSRKRQKFFGLFEDIYEFSVVLSFDIGGFPSPEGVDVISDNVDLPLVF